MKFIQDIFPVFYTRNSVCTLTKIIENLRVIQTYKIGCAFRSALLVEVVHQTFGWAGLTGSLVTRTWSWPLSSILFQIWKYQHCTCVPHRHSCCSFWVRHIRKRSFSIIYWHSSAGPDVSINLLVPELYF